MAVLWNRHSTWYILAGYLEAEVYCGFVHTLNFTSRTLIRKDIEYTTWNAYLGFIEKQ